MSSLVLINELSQVSVIQTLFALVSLIKLRRSICLLNKKHMLRYKIFKLFTPSQLFVLFIFLISLIYCGHFFEKDKWFLLQFIHLISVLLQFFRECFSQHLGHLVSFLQLFAWWPILKQLKQMIDLFMLIYLDGIIKQLFKKIRLDNISSSSLFLKSTAFPSITFSSNDYMSPHLQPLSHQTRHWQHCKLSWNRISSFN